MDRDKLFYETLAQPFHEEMEKATRTDHKTILNLIDILGGALKRVESPDLPTEELARLHATIKAIAYERGEL